MICRLSPYGRGKAHDSRQPCRFVAGSLFEREIAAATVVMSRLLAGFLLGTHLLKSLLSAVAIIGVALRDQLLGVLEVGIKSLRLEIGPIGSADIGALVPLKTKPAQSFHDSFHGSCHQAFAIGILNP